MARAFILKISLSLILMVSHNLFKVGKMSLKNVGITQ